MKEAPREIISRTTGVPVSICVPEPKEGYCEEIFTFFDLDTPVSDNLKTSRWKPGICCGVIENNLKEGWWDYHSGSKEDIVRSRYFYNKGNIIFIQFINKDKNISSEVLRIY